VDEREALARQLYETWSDEGPGVAAERFATDDLVWHDPPETPDAAVVRGRDRVVELWDERNSILGALNVQFEQAAAVGDELITTVRIRSRTERGFEMHMRHYHLLAFRGGRLARIKVFTTRQEADAAAGEPAPAAGG
jgi:ketosteroid isomerase-like protein